MTATGVRVRRHVRLVLAPLMVALTLYGVAALITLGRRPEHVHSVLDLMGAAGPWAFLFVPAFVGVRAFVMASAVDIAAALRGWGVRLDLRLRAALHAEVAVAAATLLAAVVVSAGYSGEAPVFSAGALANLLVPGLLEAGVWEREWLHALPKVVGLHDVTYALVMGISWGRLEGRRIGSALALSVAAYGVAMSVALGMMTLLAL